VWRTLVVAKRAGALVVVEAGTKVWEEFSKAMERYS